MMEQATGKRERQINTNINTNNCTVTHDDGTPAERYHNT
jgi:hypothetical protein